KRGAEEFLVLEGIAYSLQLHNTGGAVLLTGTVTVKVQTECARCLEPVVLALEGEVEGYYLLSARKEELDLEDDEFIIVEKDGVVDLAPPLFAAVLFETPQVVLCGEDCQGLCPICGINQNEQTCSCQDESLADSPFASLKDLLN
ncbi:MAG: YceD family protein, partial [Coriobacteriales bacterium]|nr:YceD family protein [Coriobacteriales bacterium]